MQNNFLRLTDLNVKQQRVLVRTDLNVPLQAGVITDDTRLQAAIPTLRWLLENQAQVIIMSHLGRPQEGIIDENFSLAPLVKPLSQALNYPVRLVKDWIQGIDSIGNEVILCENLRFLPGEKSNDPQLAQAMAALSDMYVMDAFATAHRSHASTVGVGYYAPIACAGLLLEKELKALAPLLERPAAPVVAIVGGAKVSTKLKVLEHLTEKVDHLIVGGGIANTFLAAAGFNVQASLYEPALIPIAKTLLKRHIVRLPKDVVVAQSCVETTSPLTVNLDAIQPGYQILDVGIETQDYYANLIKQAGTIIWNGPLGVFEVTPFAAGTKALAEAVADSKAYSVVGGGDTLAALARWNLLSHVSYVSTGGGAFLTYLEGKPLPALIPLTQQLMDKKS